MRHLLLVSSAFLACAVAQEPTVDGETRAHYLQQLEGLARLGDEQERSQVRRRATFALGQLGRASVPHLVELLSDPSAAVRLGACTALVELPHDDSTVTALLKLAREDPEGDVRGAALDALRAGDHGQQRVVPALIHLLQEAPDDFAQRAVADALAGRAWASEAARDALFEAWPSLEGNARPAAYEGLARSGPLATPRLIRLLASGDVVLQVEAARALSDQVWFWPEAVEPALALMEGHPNPEVREGLHSVREAQAEAAERERNARLPARRREGPHDDADLEARLAMTRTGELADRANALADLTQDLGTLSEAQRSKVALALRDSFSDRDWWVRSAAAQAAGELGLRKCLPDLLRQTRDRDLEARTRAVGALATLYDPAAVAPVRSALVDGRPRVRRAALGVVRAWGPRAAPLVPALAQLDDPNQARHVAEALGAIGPAAAPAVEGLVALVREPDLLGDDPERTLRTDLRSQALDALIRIRAEVARPALLDGLRSEHRWLRDLARDALLALELGPKLDRAVAEACAHVTEAIDAGRVPAPPQEDDGWDEDED